MRSCESSLAKGDNFKLNLLRESSHIVYNARATVCPTMNSVTYVLFPYFASGFKIAFWRTDVDTSVYPTYNYSKQSLPISIALINYTNILQFCSSYIGFLEV